MWWSLDERVERTVVLNGADAGEVVGMVGKIGRKILEEPDEPKYRQLRLDSKALSTKVLGKPGGRELLTYLGFRNAPGALTFEADLDHLRRVVAWCEQPPALERPQVELAVRLPRGTTVRAAFRKTETVRDVLEFARRYYATGDLVLQTAAPKETLDDALTLEGLAPRSAVVVAKVGALEAAEEAMDQARREGLAREQRERREMDDAERKRRRAALARKEAEARARKDALRHFECDREETHDRVERERRLRGAADRRTSDPGMNE
ncbi:hypothetical protein CTAYLR_006988 [Chrysophaeum taylorii]|uniref:UBX domain-containing protein n=1 Tax=Chrysophaeum taylorii TaxID=2483200 RepID=A0AAD7U9V3_9STRA|nr:hypothetical protein CTAYLR_006988 [Chrysophaeum taylorii]